MRLNVLYMCGNFGIDDDRPELEILQGFKKIFEK
jgi:hypothetical protein